MVPSDQQPEPDGADPGLQDQDYYEEDPGYEEEPQPPDDYGYDEYDMGGDADMGGDYGMDMGGMDMGDMGGMDF